MGLILHCARLTRYDATILLLSVKDLHEFLQCFGKITIL